MNFGPWELLIILMIVIAIFGTKKIAGIGSSLGHSIREFKSAVREEEEKSSSTAEGTTTESSDTSKTPSTAAVGTTNSANTSERHV
jgi:sec-independent protein translocase protein TatA